MLIAGVYLVSLIIVGIKFAEVELHGECPVKQTVDASADLTGKRNLFVIIVLLLGLVVVWVMYEQWMSNLARFGISTGRYGMLWTINGVLIIIFQLLLDWIGRYHATLDLQVILGSFFMAGSFMLLLFAAHYGQFVLAMVVLTLGESLLIPGVPAYVNRLSPVVQKGRGQGMVNAFSSLGKALGPLFGGLVIERLGYFKLFAVCTVADLIVGMMIGIVLLILRRGLQTYD